MAVNMKRTDQEVSPKAATDQTRRVALVAFEHALGSNFLEVPTRPLFSTVR